MGLAPDRLEAPLADSLKSNGRPTGDDDRPPQMQVGYQAGMVFLRFSRPVSAVWLTRKEAEAMAQSLAKYLAMLPPP